MSESTGQIVRTRFRIRITAGWAEKCQTMPFSRSKYTFCRPNAPNDVKNVRAGPDDTADHRETVTLTTGSRRTALELRRGQNAGPNAPFTPSHPRLKPCHQPLDGPFPAPKNAKSAANAWAHCRDSNPEGTFRCRIQGTNAANNRRGKQFHIRCSKVEPPSRGGLSCPFDLKYEQTVDGDFRLAEESVPRRWVPAAARDGRGTSRPGRFFHPRRSPGVHGSTRVVGHEHWRRQRPGHVRSRAAEHRIDITWRWDHLVRKITTNFFTRQPLPALTSLPAHSV